MIHDEEETPSRYELLSMVKKHSKLLGKTIVDEQDSSDIEMDQRFWNGILNLYFVIGRESRGRQDDDLLFFVRKLQLNQRGYIDNNEENPPYFVRRWAPKLDTLLGESVIEVDWRRSFYLNLVAHTSYTVTVAICSHQLLEKYRPGTNTPLTPVYKVVKTVYASPSRINFHLDAQKEVETTPAYPDICFAVDDFDSTFDAVVLSATDHCYCVLLNAHQGAAFPCEKLEQESFSDTSVPVEGIGERTSKNKVTIFSGFVSYQMVREAYDAGRSRFGSLLSLNHSSKQDRLFMKGPGGRGEVEVAVSGVEDQSHQIIRSPSSPVTSDKGFGFATIVRRAASAASEAAKHAYAAAAAANNSDEEMLPLKCCLMSISLPWEHIAYDLLFKGGPPVNL